MKFWKSEYKYYILVFFLLIFAAYAIKTLFFQPKIGFVKTSELINKYAGMKEASAMYKQQVQGWQKKIDTLDTEYRIASENYNRTVSGLSASQKENAEAYLNRLRENLESYAQATELKAKEEDRKLTATVYNQINSMIESYGEKHGFDAILGATTDGNVLYARTGLDITDELLEELNKDYAGK